MFNDELKSISLIFINIYYLIIRSKIIFRALPGGAVVKNPPANAGDTGSSPGPRRPHVPQSN